MVIIIWFTIAVLTNDHIGGPYGLYEKIQAIESPDNYIQGNYLGSFLTFKSKGAIMFGIVLKFGNLALVTMDTAFWQKSFAAEVHSTVPGYNLAAVSIFAVPWGLGTIVGLSARVIESLPIFPTYPNAFPIDDINAGLAMPYTLYALLGPGAAVAMLLLLFMSVTSTLSSSLIGVSSILSFDLYRTYANPNATDAQVVKFSHLGVVAYGVFIAGFALMLNYTGANMTWLYYMSPIITCPGIFPLLFTLMWNRQSRPALLLSPILGLFTGISIWIGSAYGIYGAVSMATTMEQAPALYGAMGSLFSPVFYSPLISYFTPTVFDWREFLTMELVEDKEDSRKSMPALSADSKTQSPIIRALDDEKHAATTATVQLSDGVRNLDDVVHPFDAQTLKYLNRWYKIAWGFLGTIILLTWVVWPMPLYRDYVFTKAFFSGWCSVAIFWQFFAFCAVVVYPIWDGRREVGKSIRGIVRSLTAKRGKA
jgi:Na+/proline symporter